MSKRDLLPSLRQILDENILGEGDFHDLQRTVYEDGHVTLDEADLIFKINDQVDQRPEGWNAFFVGVITDLLVRQTLPRGYVDASNAAWLMERIDHDGLLKLETELELLMNVLSIAESVPERLEAYALRQVKACVLKSEGYLADGRKVEAGVIEARDVEYLRKVLYACGGNGGFGITQLEAEILFDLDEATQGALNDPAWTDLFVGAIANHLMTVGGPEVPSYEEARRRQNWLESASGLQWNLKKSFASWVGEARSYSPTSIFMDDEHILDAERIDPVEAAWLIKRLNRDGQLSPNEKALLKFLESESPAIHSSLKPLIDAAA